MQAGYGIEDVLLHVEPALDQDDAWSDGFRILCHEGALLSEPSHRRAQNEQNRSKNH
jgi:hypothetical protein